MLDKTRLLEFDGDIGYKTHCERNVLQIGCAKRYAALYF